jgi:septum formation protein
MEPIILASSSPRRQDYFRLLGLPFSIIPAKLDEKPQPGQTPEDYTRDMAVRKINVILGQLGGRVPRWICGADTVISVDGEIFGKPLDRGEAKTMLERLQGREHEVSTSVALFNGKTQNIDCRTVQSGVRFAPLSEGEIEWYLNTGEWQGVAGSYKIQGLGGCFAAFIKGSYSAIVGLPMHEFYRMLIENGYQYGSSLSPANLAAGN